MPWVDEAASDDEGTIVVGDAKQADSWPARWRSKVDDLRSLLWVIAASRRRFWRSCDGADLRIGQW
jgi:hypothetical protein